MDETYQVKVNTREYEQKIKANTFWKCGTCGNKTPQAEIKLVSIISSSLEYSITRQRSYNVWFCPQCKESTRQNNTSKVIEEIDQPTYLKVVPAPPVQMIGLDNRFKFEFEFTKWFYNFLEELQQQLGKYRIEYIKTQGHDMADSGYVDKGDE